ITNVSGGGCAALPCTIPSLASGANVIITVTATIDAAGPFDNSASVAATEPDPDGSNNTDNTGNNGTAGVSADVSVVKTLTTGGPFTVGDSITYTLLVANAGPSTATSVQVTDTLTNLTITNVSGGGCAALPCTIPSLASGANVTITVAATITASGAFDNSATVSATEADPNLTNNTDNTGNDGTATAPNGTADLEITKTTPAAVIAIGATFDYTLVVQNHGPSTATGVTVTDPLPANFSLVSATATQGTCSGTTTVTCNVGTMLNGASVTITIRGTVSAPGTLSNTATVSANEPDPTPLNNVSSVDVAADAGIPSLSGLGLLMLGLLLASAGLVVMRGR
ncbi:MAG: DUF11 domain-containing protein, partial [Acidobacteriota bacterium]